MAINNVDFNGFDKLDLPITATDLYTVGGGLKSNLLSMLFSNKTAGSVLITVYVVRAIGGTILSLGTDFPIPAGSTLNVIDNKPIVLFTGDIVRAKASSASSIDVIGSVMETS